MVDGHLWVQQRRFILRHLRDLGFGRTNMTVQIEFEATQLVRYYQNLISDESLSYPTDDSEMVDPINENNNVIITKNEKNISKKLKSIDSIEIKQKDQFEEELVKKTVTDEEFYSKVGEDLEIEKAAKLKGVVVDMDEFFGVPVLNGLWCMMAGKRFFFFYLSFN